MILLVCLGCHACGASVLMEMDCRPCPRKLGCVHLETEDPRYVVWWGSHIYPDIAIVKERK